mmetsp:Transcript_32741/g.47267  ORF Transcript_32741/g.47267 Transcript_32741/m.47267 type:complete len:209 (+) Transcript_32741:444-1070(+)
MVVATDGGIELTIANNRYRSVAVRGCRRVNAVSVSVGLVRGVVVRDWTHVTALLQNGRPLQPLHFLGIHLISTVLRFGLERAHASHCLIRHSKFPGDGEGFLVERILQQVVRGEAFDEVALHRARVGDHVLRLAQAALALTITSPAQEPTPVLLGGYGESLDQELDEHKQQHRTHKKKQWKGVCANDAVSEGGVVGRCIYCAVGQHQL